MTDYFLMTVATDEGSLSVDFSQLIMDYFLMTVATDDESLPVD